MGPIEAIHESIVSILEVFANSPIIHPAGRIRTLPEGGAGGRGVVNGSIEKSALEAFAGVPDVEAGSGALALLISLDDTSIGFHGINLTSEARISW